MAQLRLTLVKSVIGYTKDQQLTVRALGLRKIGTTSVQEDNPVIRGMIHKVEHLVKVEKA